MATTRSLSVPAGPLALRFVKGFHHRIAQGAEWSWDSSKPRLNWPGWVLYIPVSGSVRVSWSAGEFLLDRKTVLVMRLRKEDYAANLAPDSGVELIWMHLKADADDDDAVPHLCAPGDPGLVHALASKCIQTLRASRQLKGSIRRADIWATALMDELMNHARPIVLGEADKADPAIESIHESMVQLYSKAWDFHLEAKRLGIPYSTFYRRFCARYGSGPRELLVVTRLDRAKHLLRNRDWPVEHIAEAVGYSSRSLFTRLFGKHVGMSPNAYRKLGIGA